MVKILSHFLGSHFVLLEVSFQLQKIFSFMRYHLLMVDLSICAVGFHSQHLLSQCICIYSPLSIQVQFLWLYVLVCDGNRLECAQCDKYVSLYYDTCRCQVWPAPFIKDAVFFHYVFIASFSKIRYTWVFEIMLGFLLLLCWSTLCFYANTMQFLLL
jgi:hypothetical protein